MPDNFDPKNLGLHVGAVVDQIMGDVNAADAAAAKKQANDAQKMQDVETWNAASHPQPDATPSVPTSAQGGGGVTTGSASPSKSGFGAALLQYLGVPVTMQNLQALDAWQQAEGGSVDNPFNTTQGAPGATVLPGNSAGVKRYGGNIMVGVKATGDTIRQRNMLPIFNALANGNDSRAVARALAGTPDWGTNGALMLRILG